MPVVNRLNPKVLETYKLSETDENATIAKLVRKLLPAQSGGIDPLPNAPSSEARKFGF